MEKYIFSDLACERFESENTVTDIISDTIIKINVSEKGKKHTVFFTPMLWGLTDDDFYTLRKELCFEIKNYIVNICGSKLQMPSSVLVVGLGNPHLAADALGAETVKRITVTRHIEEFFGFKVSAITPDVMGNTGIETADAVRAYTELVRPSVIIAIDALLAKSYERLASTIQISNGGIIPGGGINSSGKKLDINSLGVPVISVGVPMAVNSSTMIVEALKKGGVDSLPPSMNELLENGLNFFVTPKETEMILQSASLLLSSAIDMALC